MTIIISIHATGIAAGLRKMDVDITYCRIIKKYLWLTLEDLLFSFTRSRRFPPEPPVSWVNSRNQTLPVGDSLEEFSELFTLFFRQIDADQFSMLIGYSS
jgi:hypothetical protein